MKVNEELANHIEELLITKEITTGDGIATLLWLIACQTTRSKLNIAARAVFYSSLLVRDIVKADQIWTGGLSELQ